MDQSFNPQDYSRRITDIKCGLKELDVANSPNKAIRFLGYFFGCEKLATAMIGIKREEPPDTVFRKGFYIELNELICAASKLKLVGLETDLNSLFGSDGRSASEQRPELDRLSARELRNKVVHHLGPTHVGFILEREPFFTPIMTKFLAYDQHVLRCLKG